MPEFIPFAGFSPNCWAVFVQIEHWADTSMADKEKRRKKTDFKTHFFIAKKFQQMYSSFSDQTAACLRQARAIS